MTDQLTINEHTYSIGRMSLFDSMNVSRKIAPLLPVLFSDLLGNLSTLANQSADDATATAQEKMAEGAALVAVFEPFFKCVAQMPQDDFELVTQRCLSVVERQNANKTWSKVCVDGNIMFDDMTQIEAYQLIYRVIARDIRPTLTAFGISV